ncbi:hypothetical protein ACFQ3R_05630 [Mesonia ostreae]|uniref:Uncharacterized protein n=1 Tax=Mesonia ostreae TaxID=861110 RepID=A0ABU2KJV4_9FLAO|nr:hypothetical protein [Mesonia ostreae]MDT0294996.1 hypothetical protein [Mesonia ostreae]
MNTPHKITSNQSKKRISSSLVTGSIIAFVIAATPYIFYLYESFPEDISTWETFFFNYEAKWYGRVYISVWTMMAKFIPLLLLIIWFFTCKHWWYHVILIPMGMFFFQLLSVINDDMQYTDETEFWYVLPIMLVIVPFVYLMRVKLFKSINSQDLDDLEQEFLKNRGFFAQIKDLFK